MSTSRKKQWEIIPRSKRAANVEGLIIGGKRRKFGSARAMILTDPGEAREVDQSVGDRGSRDFTVVEVDDLAKGEENRGGKRFRKTFQVPALPWKK